MTLDEVRTKIDAIDRDLLRLLNERAECVNVVGEIKHKQGLEIYAPEREEKLLRKLVALNEAQDGRLPEKSIRAIFREIMSAALALEQPLKIAYLGPAGSRAHQVALGKFGHGVTYVAGGGAEGVFDLIATKAADYGVLPIEHSAQGAVHHTLEQFVDAALQICAQVHVSGADELRSRYIILGRKASPATGDDSTMLMLEVGDQVGALMHLLEPFVVHGINVRKIENSTSSAKEVVRFFLEVSGHQHDPSMLSVLEQLRAREVQVKVLGSYPASAWVETL